MTYNETRLNNDFEIIEILSRNNDLKKIKFILKFV